MSDFKPADFFMAAENFFSVLFPGIIICGAYYSFIFETMLQLPPAWANTGWLQWVLLFIASYFAGHLMMGIGSLLDSIFYKVYLNHVREEDYEYNHCTILKNKYCKPGTQDYKKDPLDTFQWAKTVIQIKKPEVLAGIQLLEADSKFFRSFVPTCLLLGVSRLSGLNQVNPQSFDYWLWVLLAFLCFLRYADRRYKSVKRACEKVIVMEALGLLSNAPGGNSGSTQTQVP